MKIECPHCKKDVALDWDTAVQWMTRWIGPIVGIVAITLFFPLILFVERTVLLPEFAAKGQADMGFKHGAWVLGALGGKFTGAQVHAYGPLYGSGGAVVEFNL